jgi:hypothetical protein
MPYLSFSVQNFPWLSDTTYNMPLKWKRGQTFKILLTTPYVRIKLCDTQTVNRKLSLENNHYDVSLCDLVDRKLDFVLDVHNTVVYWKQNSTPMWWNLLITLTNLFFFTRVYEHLQLLINGKRRKFSVLTTSAIVFLLLLYRILLETLTNVDGVNCSLAISIPHTMLALSTECLEGEGH